MLPVNHVCFSHIPAVSPLFWDPDSHACGAHPRPASHTHTRTHARTHMHTHTHTHTHQPALTPSRPSLTRTQSHRGGDLSYRSSSLLKLRWPPSISRGGAPACDLDQLCDVCRLCFHRNVRCVFMHDLQSDTYKRLDSEGDGFCVIAAVPFDWIEALFVISN